MKKVILITGCSSGLGKYLAELLAQQGYIVYAGIRNNDERKKLTHFWKTYPNLFPVQLDITNDKHCHDIIAAIIKEQGRLDVMINNAGYTLAGSLETFTTEQFTKLLDTNVIGAFRLIREVLPKMKERKKGHIINITSLNGLVALPNFSLYCSSKFALEGLTRSLITELVRDNIYVTNIEPGAMKGEVDMDKQKELPHKPARERFWIIKVLMPIISITDVAQKIATIIENKNPPTNVLMGTDTKITTFLQRILPTNVWNVLLKRIWHG